MKLLNFGSCNIDYVYLLDHIVAVGETESAENLHVFSGGKGLNQSIAIARAGVEVYHAGCIGEDGDFLAELLKKNKVNVSYLKRVNDKNGHAIIQLTGAGENSIFIYPGSNAMVSKMDIDETLSHFEKGDIILLQNEISGVAYIIDEAYKKGMRVILNPSPINDIIANIDFNKLSYLVLNEIEAKMITQTTDVYNALEFFRDKYPSLAVILTLGSRGSIYQDDKERLHQPSFEVKVKDTTGAGDTFTGYFVAELVKGTGLKNALEIASCASALAVSRNGAAPSIPVREEVISSLSVLKPRLNHSKDEVMKKNMEEYIDDNLTSITLKSLAETLGYSVVYTGALVKRLTGMGYKKYLMERRLLRATELLKNTEMPIEDIILAVGYENESYFRKKFFEKYRKKPLEYRKSFIG